MKKHFMKKSSAVLAAAVISAAFSAGNYSNLLINETNTILSTNAADTNGIKVESAGGWNEMLYLVLSGVKHSDVTGLSYSGPSNGTFSADDLAYLLRDTSQGLRVDIPGLKAGRYSVTITT